ncbi:ABC-2 type transporter-domain-containing protein [Aspergillus pseudocaelatus]|uniref:ABC-2 type transporter-domain-containing protein n=1 Tax=Aspergillus pseudocaelatus TaxID=1825620 RepID=A0ABQ6W0X5_9EURO|nr:ABC-2 type transporter-domain-containing protein [Aspergillus pseudocaelatus]
MENEEVTCLEKESAGIDHLVNLIIKESEKPPPAQNVAKESAIGGVAWRNLCVDTVDQSTASQSTCADLILGIPKALQDIITGSCSRTVTRRILTDFNGCVQPREMVLVLGKPGSGCSTFLRTIGDFRRGLTIAGGEVQYGQGKLSSCRPEILGGECIHLCITTINQVEVILIMSLAVYHPEDDYHHPALTVRDTLEFALAAGRNVPDKSPEARNHRAPSALPALANVFGLEDILDTKIGDETTRGLSSGERRRISIAEAFVAGPRVQCWDNPSEGLDAYTVTLYVQALKRLTIKSNSSTLVALKQLPEEAYHYFDKVLMIDEGRCVFFGSTRDAVPYFERLGFSCPRRWTSSDFLNSISHPYIRITQPDCNRRAPQSAKQLYEAYYSSEAKTLAAQEMDEYFAEVKLRGAKIGRSTDWPLWRRSANSFLKQTALLCRRQFLTMLRDRASLLVKWQGILFQAFITGSMFFLLSNGSAGSFPRGSVLFTQLFFHTSIALADLTASFQNEQVIQKHKAFGFYRPAAYVLANTLLNVAVVFVQVFAYNVILYFMSNLARTPSQFFINLLFVCQATLTMSSVLHAVASWLPSLDHATRVTGFAVQLAVMYTGYLLPPWKQPGWLKWLQWLDPLSYAFSSIMVNEFGDKAMQCEGAAIIPTGPTANASHQGCSVAGNKPNELIVQGADYLAQGFGYSRSHLWRDFGIQMGLLVFFVVLTMLGMEFRSSRLGPKITLLKRGEAKRNRLGKYSLTHESVPGAASSPAVIVGSTSPNVRIRARDDLPQLTGPIIPRRSLTWENLHYRVRSANREGLLLQNITGRVKAGQLIALMGVTGSGKSTLLEVLGQQIKTGHVSGKILLDEKYEVSDLEGSYGYRPIPQCFRRNIGFAKQLDVHEPTATVRETLRFAALLRRSEHIPIAEKFAHCEYVLDMLELQPIANAIVGSKKAGLNAEQLKRLTIAVQLASRPEFMVFLDEPTTNLDFFAATNMVRLLRRLADGGLAVICSIHQPSTAVFEQFDELMLLQNGGRLVYHGKIGSACKELIEYFENQSGQPYYPCGNPIEFVLKVVGSSAHTCYGRLWSDAWLESEQCRRLEADMAATIRVRYDSPGSSVYIDGSGQYATSIWFQIIVVLKRVFLAYWRSPNYIFGKLAVHIFTGLLSTFTFWQLGHDETDFLSRLLNLFVLLGVAQPVIQQLQPKFIHWRNMYKYVDRDASLYPWFVFVLAASIPEILCSLVVGTAYYLCWYWGTGFPRDSFSAGYSWMMVILFEFYCVGFGQMLAACSPNELFASTLVPPLYTFVINFCGIVPYGVLPSFWRSWMFHLSPFRYLVEGLFSVMTHNIPVHCSDREATFFTPPPELTCLDYVKSYQKQLGGNVRTLTNGVCAYCPYATGDDYAAGLNMLYRHRWRDMKYQRNISLMRRHFFLGYKGIFSGYVFFNFFAVLALSWLYFRGMAVYKRLVRLATSL